MEESILYPSPNWFLPTVLAVSKDGWVVYGGPGKTLVVLEPLSQDSGGVVDSDHRHKAHVVNSSNKERVVSVDISPQWPEKRQFVTGSSDGAVKVWTITQLDNKWVIKNTQSHEVHANGKEEVVGVGFSMSASHIISVGNFSNITVWELNTNVTQLYSTLMKSFRATCMTCSPHLELVVAVGTKQGVVFVLDLNGKGSLVYKVRGQDDEIGQVVWCPQYEVVLKRSLEPIKSIATLRMEKIRNEPEPNEPDASGVNITLPNDSFDEPIVQEDEMFDIYKDHAAEEFGHKKYQPEDILVKKKEDTKENDFLAECLKLKAQILKNKEEAEEPIANLVDAMDKAHLDCEESQSSEDVKPISGSAKLVPSGSKLVTDNGSSHIHKHLLASVSKNGFSVRIWSKTGKIVSSCAIVVSKPVGKQFVNKQPQYASLCWYKPDLLLIADGKVNLVECNPLQLDCRNRLQWSVVHSAHRRGIYCIASSGPKLQVPETDHSEEWSVWSVAQDRFLVKYSMKERKVLAKYGTCGGAIYDVRPCPYDAGKLAISVGDGSLRVLESRTCGEEDNKLTHADVTCYWQNVQGKVLQTAWHPTKENLLAFSTAESRVGIIQDISKPEKPARVLQTALSGGVYSLAWGGDMVLYAVGGRELVMYHANKPDLPPIPIHIEIEGQVWEPSVVNYSALGLVVGSTAGGVALFSGPGGDALAAKFVYSRQIHALEWHPQQTSSSDVASPCRDLLALSSTDRASNICVIKYEDKEGGGKQFSDYTTLSGHTKTVLQLYWSPHRDGQLLSTSVDATVRIWDVVAGTCVSIFSGHCMGTLGAAWCPWPQLPGTVLSGGNDFTLRLWALSDHPAENYKEVPKREPQKRSRSKKNKIIVSKAHEVGEENAEDRASHAHNVAQPNDDDDDQSGDEMACDVMTVTAPKPSKRYIMPIIGRDLNKSTSEVPRLIIKKYIEKHKEISSVVELANNGDGLSEMYLVKLFGTINDVNEVLDMECASHLELRAYKEYIMLQIFRGHIDTVVQFANEHDLLDPFILSIAPCVSFKYWKDVVQLYIAQLDRLAVKPTPPAEVDITLPQVPDKSTFTPGPGLGYGGVVYRKAAALLSVHDVRGAVHVLEKGRLFKEAYILCRCRHMDSIAQETLHKWATCVAKGGDLAVAALLQYQTRLNGEGILCEKDGMIIAAIYNSFLYWHKHLVMGNISAAAHVLRRSNSQEVLNFAAELAKIAGHNTFADFIENKVKTVEKESPESNTEEYLAELPTRMELLMKENKVQNGEAEFENSIDQTESNPTKTEICGNGDKVQNGTNATDENSTSEVAETTV